MKLSLYLIKLIFIIFFSSLYLLTNLNAKLLPIDTTLVQGKLKNGFNYTIKENRKPKNRAELRLIIKIGSLEEEDDQKGVAHFIEHLAFNGTTNFKKNSLIQYLESIGVTFGKHLNASTGYEETIYKLTIPIENDNLEKSFLIFRDWADALTFNPIEFNKERGVILEEARSRDRVGLRLYNKSKHTVLNNSKFLERLPIGDKEVIKNISLKRVKEFYYKWYRPEFMHFIAVGDFNSSNIEILIKKYFSSLKNNHQEKRASRNIPDVNHTQVISLTDKELMSSSLSVQYIDTITYPSQEQDIKDEVIEAILNNLFNLKTEEQELKDNPFATSILLNSKVISNQKASYNFQVNYRDKNALPALQELYEIIFSFQKYGFSKENFELIQNHQLKLNEKKYKRIKDKKSKKIISRLVHYAKNSAPIISEKEIYRLKQKFIKEVTLKDIKNKFKEILSIKNRVITFIDADKNKISKTNVFETIKKAEENLTDYTKTVKLSLKLLEIVPKKRKVISKTYNNKIGVYEFILENEIKILFKPTDFSKNKVQLYATSLGGTSFYSDNQLNNATKASSFVKKSGIGKFSSTEITKLLSGKDIFVSIYLSKLSDNIYATANSQDIESMFQLMYLKIKQSKIDNIAANNFKRYLKDKIQQHDRNPKIKFAKERLLFEYKNNPRIQYDTNESIENLDNLKMLQLFKNAFSDMNNFNFFIVGDIEPKKLETLISKYIGNLPTQKRKNHFIDRTKEYLRGKQLFIRNYNNKNISNIEISYKSEIKFTNKNYLLLDALSSILKIRLRESLREDNSGIYSISVKNYISRIGKENSGVKIKFSCDPKRKDELISLVYAVIQQLKAETITQKELKVYNEQFQKNYETVIKTNSFWIINMVRSHRVKMPIDDILLLPTIVNQFSIEDIREIANQVFLEDILQSELTPINKH